VDPWFIVAEHPEEARIINMARTVNDSMPERVVEKVKECVQHISDPKVTMLGLAYKANVDDTRESPAGIIFKLLKDAGIRVFAYDPHVKQSKIELSDFKEAFVDSDCILLVTNHDEFTCMDPAELAKLVRTRTVLDTRNCLNAEKWAKAGFTTRLLGKGKTG
jgi:UDP-N-acetyl-D-mannosaminuronic acid dehydrogenase